MRPAFPDILQRLEDLYRELPDEEHGEMQRLVKISQEKVEEIRKQSERLALEKLKNRLLEASNRFDSVDEAERRKKRLSQPAPSSTMALSEESAPSSSSSASGLPRILSTPSRPIERRTTLGGFFLSVLIHSLSDYLIPGTGSRLQSQTGSSIRPSREKRMSAVDIFNTRRGPPSDFLALMAAENTNSETVGTPRNQPPLSSSVTTDSPTSHTNALYGPDANDLPMMTDVFNPNQTTYQGDGPFKKKSQAELNMKLLQLAQEMREKEELTKQEEITKKQRRMSWGGRKKDSVLTKGEEPKKEKKNKGKSKRSSRRFTLSFPSISKRKSAMLSPRRALALSTPAPLKPSAIEREGKEREGIQEDVCEEDGKEESEQDLHAGKEEVFEDKDGQVLTLR